MTFTSLQFTWFISKVYLLFSYCTFQHHPWDSQVALAVKNPLTKAGDPGLIPRSGRSPGGGNGNRSSIFAWRIPWTEEPGWLQSIELQKVGHNCNNLACSIIHLIRIFNWLTTRFLPFKICFSMKKYLWKTLGLLLSEGFLTEIGEISETMGKIYVCDFYLGRKVILLSDFIRWSITRKCLLLRTILFFLCWRKICSKSYFC